MDSKGILPKAKKRALLVPVLPKPNVSENRIVPFTNNSNNHHAPPKASMQSSTALDTDSEEEEEEEHTDSHPPPRTAQPVLPAMAHPPPHHPHNLLESRSLFPKESLRHLADSPIRRTTKRKRVTGGVSTEAMAVAHIVHDEVRDYLTSQSLPREERLFLIQWYKAVRDQLIDQNELLVENGRLATERRHLDQQIRQQRQELVALRSQMRGVERDIQDLEQRIVVNQQQSRAQRDATRFLEGLGQLAVTSQSADKDDSVK